MKRICLLAIFGIALWGCSSKASEKVGRGSYQSENGEIISAKIQFEDNNIDEVEFDSTIKDEKKTKMQLKNAYNMRQASPINKEWFQQVEYLEDYIEENGMDKIELDKDGKAKNSDIKTGCTISIEGFLKALDDATQKTQ